MDKSLIHAKNFLEDKHIINFNGEHFDVRDAVCFNKFFTQNVYKFKDVWEHKFLQAYYGRLSIYLEEFPPEYYGNIEELKILFKFNNEVVVTYFYNNSMNLQPILEFPFILFDEICFITSSTSSISKSVFFEGYEIQSRDKRRVLEDPGIQVNSFQGSTDTADKCDVGALNVLVIDKTYYYSNEIDFGSIIYTDEALTVPFFTGEGLAILTELDGVFMYLCTDVTGAVILIDCK